MYYLKLAELSKALNLKDEDISEIKQISDNKIKIKWKDEICQTFITEKPIKLITNRLPNAEVCFDIKKLKNTKTITYRKSDTQGNAIPCIIIEGKFLKSLGFELGDKVKMDYQKNKITILNNKKGVFFDN